MLVERFQPEWIDAPVRVRHPAVIALKLAAGGLFVAPAVAIWAVCFGIALLWIGTRRAAARVRNALRPHAFLSPSAGH